MATFEHSEIIIFFRFIRDMLPQIRHKHGEFLKLLADIFATLPRINSDSLPSLSELCNEIRVCCRNLPFSLFLDRRLVHFYIFHI